jgi:hypothetical protein
MPSVAVVHVQVLPCFGFDPPQVTAAAPRVPAPILTRLVGIPTEFVNWEL